MQIAMSHRYIIAVAIRMELEEVQEIWEVLRLRVDYCR